MILLSLTIFFIYPHLEMILADHVCFKLFHGIKCSVELLLETSFHYHMEFLFCLLHVFLLCFTYILSSTFVCIYFLVCFYISHLVSHSLAYILVNQEFGSRLKIFMRSFGFNHRQQRKFCLAALMMKAALPTADLVQSPCIKSPKGVAVRDSAPCPVKLIHILIYLHC